MDSRLVQRTVIAGGILGGIGIGLFFGMWVLMGSLGATPFARVVVSVCLPPVLLAAGIGVYLVVTRTTGGAAAGNATPEPAGTNQSDTE